MWKRGICQQHCLQHNICQKVLRYGRWHTPPTLDANHHVWVFVERALFPDGGLQRRWIFADDSLLSTVFLVRPSAYMMYADNFYLPMVCCILGNLSTFANGLDIQSSGNSKAIGKFMFSCSDLTWGIQQWSVYKTTPNLILQNAFYLQISNSHNL
jgi:hypothetical protein